MSVLPTATATLGTATPAAATAATSATLTFSSSRAASEATTSAFTGSLGTGHGYRQRTTFVSRAVQVINGLIGLLFAGHFHEPKAFTKTSFPVCDHLGRFNGSIRGKNLGKDLIVHRIRETTDIQFIRHETSIKVVIP